jgi:DNA-binding MltR family transcriptional regulator
MSKKARHSQEDISTFLKELNTQTDRGAAVIAAAVLDDLLQIFISERFIEIGSDRHDALFKKTGAPLSTFSSRIEIAYAIGLISNEMRLAFHLIRDVRNAFAHRIEQITFDYLTVADMIKTLAIPLGVNQAKSNRAQYLELFNMLAMVIYGCLRMSNLRIKTIMQTHNQEFHIFADQMQKAIQKAKSGKGDTHPQSGSDPTKP